jgi:DNA-binding transcriptional LysR family regulator
MRRAELISRQLKLRQLRILVEVAQRGSMVKASGQLGISQPVISKAIADLEGVLGVRLLDRLPQGVEPTPYGRALINRSVAIFDDLTTGVSEIEFLADPMSGELRIGASEGMASGLLPNIISRLASRHPRVTFDIVLADAVALQQRELRNRKVDLVIANILVQADEAFETTILHDARQLVVAARKSRWTASKAVGLADLANESWCLPPPNHPVRSAIDDVFRGAGLAPPQPAVTVASPQMVMTMVAQFGYLGVVGAVVLKSNPLAAQLRPLPVNLPVQNLASGIVTLKNRTLSPVVQLFMKTAREVVGELAAT